MKKILINLKRLVNSSTGAKDKVTFKAKIDSPDKEKISIRSPLAGSIEFTNLGKKILADFDFKIKIKINCFRCGEDFIKKIQPKFERIYKFSDLGADQNLDILPTIFEETLLSVPIQPLCRNTCQGRCQKCGANLNIKKCHCHKSIKNENRPFAKLKKLLRQHDK
jgi:uncharacterized protein